MAHGAMRTMLLGTVVLLACSGGRGTATTIPNPASRSVAAAAQPLPTPMLDGGVSLEKALVTRRSIRSFEERPLSLAQKGQLLWAAQGITDAGRGLRTAPSAGAKFGLVVYLLDESGGYRYEPHAHALRPHLDSDVRSPLAEAGLGQQSLKQGAAIIVITGDAGRLVDRYGERAQRYTILEGGHAAQNVLLQATAMGLGSVPVGGFDSDAVKRVLQLPDAEEPIYLLPVGYPVR